jgi:chromosome segregation ATPase
MSTQTDRLDVIKAELNELLEARIGHLLGVVRAAQAVTRQIVATDEEIRRQEHVHEALEAELAPLKGTVHELAASNEELRGRVASARTNVDRMKSLREELMSNLSNLRADDE